jgi:hypothetical protein
MAPGSVRAFNGTLRYSGPQTTQPSSVTFDVSANAVGIVCGANTTNASLSVPVAQMGDLVVIRVDPNEPRLNQSDSGTANVTIHNSGQGNITGSTDAYVLMRRCNSQDIDGSGCSFLSDDIVPTPPLAGGEDFSFETASYSCGGYRYVRIDVTANFRNDTTVGEDNFLNNRHPPVFIECPMQKCEVSGPDQIMLPGYYQYDAVCYIDSSTIVNCTDMIDGAGFAWTSFPSPAPFVNYLNPVWTGPVGENATIQVFNTLANGTLYMTASAKVAGFGQTINCTKPIQILANPCIEQI